MKGLRFLLWLVFFVALTFAFVTLFTHGPSNFVTGLREEASALAKLFS